MREYRIYDNELKEYCEEPDYRWMLSRSGKLYNSESDKWHTIGDRFIIEFSTKLTDKNGVKIFEGDVAINGKGENVLIKIGEHGIIDEDDENIYYGVYIEYNKTKYPFVVGTTTNFIEVIGNIHDNQELLKK